MRSRPELVLWNTKSRASLNYGVDRHREPFRGCSSAKEERGIPRKRKAGVENGLPPEGAG